MAAPPRNSDSDLTKREQLAVSGGALTDVPWRAAGVAGLVVAGGDLLLHVLGGHLTLGGPLSAGIVALFAVAGAGLMLRKRVGRAAQWAKRNPWTFAVVPGAAVAILVFVLSVVFGGGVFGGVFTALWHGAIAYGVTGVAGAVAGSRQPRAARSRPGGSRY